MLKHLPEGLVPFEDCGFARHPFAPLAMEPVRVDCRVGCGGRAARAAAARGRRPGKRNRARKHR